MAEQEISPLPNYTWLKLPVSYLDNADFTRLSDAAVSVYVKIYLMALRADAEGIVANDRRPYTPDDIAWQLHKPEAEIQATLEELKAAGFVDIGEEIRLVRFQEEQGPGDNTRRAQWRDRQQRRRKKLLAGDSEQSSLEENSLEQQRIAEQREEKKKSRVEESRVESHRDITVTGDVHGDIVDAALTSSFSELEPLAKERYGKDYKPRSLARAIKGWRKIAAAEGWKQDNNDAILDLCDEDALRARLDRYSFKMPTVDYWITTEGEEDSPRVYAIWEFGQREELETDGNRFYLRPEGGWVHI